MHALTSQLASAPVDYIDLLPEYEALIRIFCYIVVLTCGVLFGKAMMSR